MYFAVSPRASRIDVVARALLERGIQMRGSNVSTLMCVFDGTLVELGSRDVEDAFTAWWLR